MVSSHLLERCPGEEKPLLTHTPEVDGCFCRVAPADHLDHHPVAPVCVSHPVSGFNLVASMRRDGRHIVGVVMGGRTGSSRDAHMRDILETHVKRASTGVFWTRQAFLATWDLTLHGPTADLDANALWFELMPRLTPLPPTPGTVPPASFMPVMGGYDANYYGYLWSRVYAQDLFSVFVREGLP